MALFLKVDYNTETQRWEDNNGVEWRLLNLNGLARTGVGCDTVVFGKFVVSDGPLLIRLPFDCVRFYMRGLHV